MTELIIVTQILGGVIGTAFVLWVGRYFYKQWVNKKMLNEINQQQSRNSVLKLMLKTRLKKNCNSVTNIFKGEVLLVNLFQEKYDKLAILDLSSNEHYNKIIDVLKESASESEAFFAKKYKYAAKSLEIENEMKRKAENKDPVLIEYEHLVSFDLPCLLMIKEIAITQQNSRILIEKYNAIQETKKEMIKMPVEININDSEILFKLVDDAYEKKKQTDRDEAQASSEEFSSEDEAPKVA